MSSSPPSTLGQYQIIREIARSNDIVYEAYDPLMNRRVAVKELAMPAGMTDAQKQDRISRFKREAQAAGTLNHPNIMTVYSFAEDAGRTFMALEFLDGHTLRNEIDTKGFLPADQAVEVACSILEGLGHAHSKGVIHRDIKPDNVQILSNGQVKITDFGIARLTFQPNLTMDGQVFGTPSYMSPEQVVGRDIDQRSDLFSVAVVLYEMLSGQKPFAGDSVVTITYAIMNKEPQQPTQCDWALWQVLNRALDKSPQLRYNTAADMIDALRDARKQAQSGMMTGPNQTQGFNPNHPNNPNNVYTNPYANPTAGYAPLNPGQGAYGAPQAPYNQQPYNPYGGTPPPAPPPQYPYNPYQAGNVPTGYAPMPSMPPPAPIPIYYPPPPRAPLLKPDTVIFLKKFAVALIILGTLFAIVIVGLSSLAGMARSAGTGVEDERIARQIRELDPRVPLDERITSAQGLVNRLPSNNRTQSSRALSELMALAGKEAAQQGQTASAESYYVDATQVDPTNVPNLAALGDLYFRRAQSAAPEDRVKLLQQSGEALRQASVLTTNAVERTRFGEAAANAYIQAAGTLYQINPAQRGDIRELLNNARDSAPSGSSVVNQVEDLLRRLRSEAGQ